MKILFCVGTLSNGGAERVICTLANNFAKKNNIKIVSITKTNIAYELDRNIDVDFIDNEYFDNRLPKKRRIRKNIKRLIKLKKTIKEFKPDIIISFMVEPSFLVLMLKKSLKIPTIISVRNDPKVEYSSRLYNILMKKLYPKADGIVFQTNDAMEYFDNIVKTSKIVIPNPIKNEFICDSYKGKRRNIIVNVGRLQEQKNQEVLIKAFSMLGEKYDEYKLIIYGNGILENKLNDLIKELKLENRVILAGTTTNIKKEIQDASLFVLSSRYEGMPNALMEAMALGLPVISTDCPCGGPRFLIENNKNGILVKNEDVNELTSAIKKVLDSKKLADTLGKNASKIKNYLAEEIICDKWMKYILEINNK